MTLVYLSDVSEGRDNNFNLIRIVAATAVLVSHAWPLTLGRSVPEPLETLTGWSLGSLAVMVFFAISGFLIARSFERQPTLGRWLMARGLRLFPGLGVMLLLTVIVLGVAASDLPPQAYFSQPETLGYVLRNLTLAVPQFTLPGVFGDNPSQAVNGSLWTLFYEVVCYGGVMVLGLVGAFRRRWRLVVALMLFAFAYAAIQLTPLREAVPDKLVRLSRLGLPFAIGMAFYVWRARLPLHPGPLLALTLLTLLARDTPLYRPLFALGLCYAVFLAAYLPRGRLLLYNRLGDYSYGVYIYAFPVQQLTVLALGAGAPWLNIAVALPVTLACAVLSWVWIERPSLTLARAPLPHIRTFRARNV